MYLASVHYFGTKSKKRKNGYFILIKRGIWIPFFHSIFYVVALLSHDCLLGCCLGDRLNHPVFITVVSLLFKLEDKKEFHEEIKSQWSTLRGFNWQHSKSHIIPQPSDLFCHTILLTKFNMLTSFSPHFVANIERAYTPAGFSIGARAQCLPPKNMEGLFCKSFSLQMGVKCCGNVLHGGLTIRSYQGWGSFTNAFSSNLKTVHKSWNFC